MRYVLADSNLNIGNQTDPRKNLRGLNVWTLTELRGITGQTKRGEFINAKMQYPLFSLSPEERVGIMQACSYVQAVVGSRMNRISSLEWSIVPKKAIEDRLYEEIKEMYELYNEYNDPNDLNHLMLRFRLRQKLRGEYLHDLKDDMSNYQTALMRFKRRIGRASYDKTQEITDWISEPNMEDEFDDFIKKYVESFMIHGATGIYKEWLSDKLDNFYILPGGTVYPLRSETVGEYVAYAQIIIQHIPKIYFQDEVCFTQYLPSAARSYGYVPLDSLINKTAESMLFDQFAAERADGTKEPEKLIIFGDTRNPYGDLTGEINLPMNMDEQKRIEEKLNTIRQGAIATLSGVGTPVVSDISKADTFQAQSQRQDKLLRDIALVFNMTNMEINLAGGEFTSGKETSESQSDIEEGKGTKPIIQKIQTIMNKHILPFRFGSNFLFEYKKGLSEAEQIDLDTRKWNSQTYTKNEIRTARGDDPIIEDGNDTLNQQSAAPAGTEINPLHMKSL